MKAIGFELKSEQVRFCVLQGTRNAPTYVIHGIRDFRNPIETSELMNFMRQTFTELFDKYSPDAAGYRLAMSIHPSIKKADQYPSLYFSYGIMNLLAHDRRIQTTMFNSNSFTPAFFGMKSEKGKKPDKNKACDEILGLHPPHWDDSTRLAALSALGVLK